jgi:hypothetical protein
VTTELSSSERFAAFDKLRAFSMLFIVFFHASLAYCAGAPWYFKDPGRSRVFLIATWATTGFTLRIFFVVAGFFARMVYLRRGAIGFAKHRLVRIAVPFAVGTVVWSHFVSWQRGTPLHYRPLHLWFLEFLLLISVIVPSAAAAFSAFADKSAISAVDWLFQRLVRSRWAPLLLGIPTAVILSFQGHEPDPSVIETPDGFWPHAVVLGYYTCFFGFGWMLHRHCGEIDGLSRRYRWFLGYAVLTRLVGLFVFFARGKAEGLASHGWLSATLYLHAGLFTWFTVLGFIGLFQRRFARDTALARYVSDSSYWCYLVHLLPVTMLQTWLMPLTIPVFCKFIIVCVLSMAFSLTTYEYLCRYTVVGWVLNGKRDRHPGPRSLAWRSIAEATNARSAPKTAAPL